MPSRSRAPRRPLPRFCVASLACILQMARSSPPSSDQGKGIRTQLSSVLVVVALDEMDQQRLSDHSPETNMHSLRALWTKGNFWDIQVRHDGCPVACEFSAVQKLLPRADAILFSMQVFPGLGHFEDVMVQRLQEQTTILWSTEASQNYRLGPQLPLISSMVDVTATYELDSHIPVISFPSTVSQQDFTDPEPHVMNDGRALVVWVASNCESTPNRRTDYVKDLMKYMEVDSYGRCLHTKDLPEGFESERSGAKFWQDKVRLLQGYRFALVTENTNAADYVTEKLFQALLAGTVPVYMGAKNVESFLPDGDVIIAARNYSPRDLAAYLERLASDEEAYARFLSWRRRPLPERFLRLWDWSWDTAKCRICSHVAANAQPQTRIDASLAASSDWKGMLKRGCEAEDGGLLRLATRLYQAAHFLSPFDEIAKSGLLRIRSMQQHAVEVETAGKKYQVQIPTGDRSLCNDLEDAQVKARCLSAVNPATVMNAVDSFCLEFHVPFGPECQSVFTTVGLYLERQRIPVWPTKPWKSKELLGSNTTLCKLLHERAQSRRLELA